MPPGPHQRMEGEKGPQRWAKASADYELVTCRISENICQVPSLEILSLNHNLRHTENQRFKSLNFIDVSQLDQDKVKLVAEPELRKWGAVSFQSYCWNHCPSSTHSKWVPPTKGAMEKSTRNRRMLGRKLHVGRCHGPSYVASLPGFLPVQNTLYGQLSFAVLGSFLR